MTDFEKLRAASKATRGCLGFGHSDDELLDDANVEFADGRCAYFQSIPESPGHYTVRFERSVTVCTADCFRAVLEAISEIVDECIPPKGPYDE